MRTSAIFGGSVALFTLTGVCCQALDQAPDYPMLVENCDLGDGGACPPPSLGGSGTGASHGTGGSDAGIDLTGGVALVSSPSFDLATATPYQGTANVVGSGAQGAVTAPYGGPAGTKFDLAGVSAGAQWVLVQDTSGSSMVLSTWSSVTVPSAAPVTLPLLDTQTLAQIAASANVGGGLSPTAAQVIVRVTKGGAPLANVTVSGAMGAVVVYDTGPGTYSAAATATGSGGTILLFNAALSGPGTLTLKDNTSMATYAVPVHAAPGAATMALSAN